MQLKFRPSALVDLEEIYDYIAADNPMAAADFIAVLREKCERLKESPRIGRERSEVRAGLYSFPVRRYVIFYRIEGRVLEIVNVLHSARDIQAFFDMEP